MALEYIGETPFQRKLRTIKERQRIDLPIPASEFAERTPTQIELSQIRKAARRKKILAEREAEEEKRLKKEIERRQKRKTKIVPRQVISGIQRGIIAKAPFGRETVRGQKTIKRILKAFTPKPTKRRGRSRKEMAMLREIKRLKQKARLTKIPPRDHLERGSPQEFTEAESFRVPQMPEQYTQTYYPDQMPMPRRPGILNRLVTGFQDRFMTRPPMQAGMGPTTKLTILGKAPMLQTVRDPATGRAVGW